MAEVEPIYSITGKRVFIAGHRGMVGSALVRRLAGERCEILTVPRVELDLRRYKWNILIEMYVRNVFPRIGDLPYLLTMGPYQFFWFRLRKI